MVLLLYVLVYARVCIFGVLLHSGFQHLLSFADIEVITPSNAVWVILNFFVPFFSPARKINYFFRRRKINRYFSRRYLARILFSRCRKKLSIIFLAREKNAGLLSRHVLGFTCLIPVALICRYLRTPSLKPI